MSKAIESTEATAFFAAQMLVCVIRSLVESGVYSADVARTNIQETIDQGTVTLSEAHHQYLSGLGQAFHEIVQRAENRAR
jgi:hypothetical protein